MVFVVNSNGGDLESFGGVQRVVFKMPNAKVDPKHLFDRVST